MAGRLAVRFRWAIVLAWIAGTAAAMVLLPSLSNATQSDNTSFLPASAPSEQAAKLASPLQGASLTAVTVVAARAGGALTGADQAAIARLSDALARVARVTTVRDAGQSADGRAEQVRDAGEAISGLEKLLAAADPRWFAGPQKHAETP